MPREPMTRKSACSLSQKFRISSAGAGDGSPTWNVSCKTFVDIGEIEQRESRGAPRFLCNRRGTLSRAPATSRALVQPSAVAFRHESAQTRMETRIRQQQHLFECLHDFRRVQRVGDIHAHRRNSDLQSLQTMNSISIMLDFKANAPQTGDRPLSSALWRSGRLYSSARCHRQRRRTFSSSCRTN